MNKISCDICMDLLPLVADDVASEDSRAAVLKHIETCEMCRRYYNQDEKPIMNNHKVTMNIKKQLIIVVVGLIALGIAFGIGIANSELMFYNILLMPTIGVVSFVVLKKKSIFIALFVFVTVCIRYLFNSWGYGLESNILDEFNASCWWASIYAGLCLLGIIIGFLFYFGFRKEENHEKDS